MPYRFLIIGIPDRLTIFFSLCSDWLRSQKCFSPPSPPPRQKRGKKKKEKRSSHALPISSVAYWWLGSLQAFGIIFLLFSCSIQRYINFCHRERWIFTTLKSILIICNKKHCTSWYCHTHTFLVILIVFFFLDLKLFHSVEQFKFWVEKSGFPVSVVHFH